MFPGSACTQQHSELGNRVWGTTDSLSWHTHHPVQALLPLLKYMRGEVFSPEHWHEHFRMLGMPRGTTLEKLTFGDVISAADAITNGADRLKE